MKPHVLFALALSLGVTLAGCHEKQEVTAPPPPLRPEPQPVEKPRVVQKDCDPIDKERDPVKFDNRSIPEGNRLAEQARTMLKMADTAEVERSLREQYITDAVRDLLTALDADPYNVTAHYLLAAAYARIDRRQCSINLLTRLLQLRAHPSKRAEVDKHLDRLLGRKQALDPDFAEMRRDERFRGLIQKMCEGTNDPNCVYGAQRENRER